jgi:hypothetical protein
MSYACIERNEPLPEAILSVLRFRRDSARGRNTPRIVAKR